MDIIYAVIVVLGLVVFETIASIDNAIINAKANAITLLPCFLILCFYFYLSIFKVPNFSDVFLPRKVFHLETAIG